MPAPGWPDWLSHLWYRANHAVLMTGFGLAFSFRFEGARHIPSHGPALLLANHQSFLDPPLVGVAALRDIHYLARKTLFNNRLLAWYMRSVNAEAVDQEGVAKEGLKATIDLLRAGQAVLVFPEGERTPDGSMLPMKGGVHVVIKRAPAPIVPIGIAGAFEAFPRSKLLPRPSPFFLPATNAGLAVSIGKPLEPELLLKLSREEFLKVVFDALQAAQVRAERLRRKPRNEAALAERRRASGHASRSSPRR